MHGRHVGGIRCGAAAPSASARHFCGRAPADRRFPARQVAAPTNSLASSPIRSLLADERRERCRPRRRQYDTRGQTSPHVNEATSPYAALPDYSQVRR
jgi:hypothetical protein